MKGIIIKPFQTGQEEIYLNLYNYVHPQKMTMDVWRWKNLNGPMGGSIIETAWDGTELVGMYGLIPVILYDGGKLVKGGISDVAVTHPDYRYRGIFSALGKNLYEKAAGQGIEYIFGFPTEHSVHGFKGSLEWDCISRNYVLYCWGCQEKTLETNDYVIYQSKIEGYALDRIWKRVASGIFKNFRITERNKNYLKWRLDGHPGVEYSLYIAGDGPGIPAGYAVVRFHEEWGEKYCDIVDVIASGITCFRSLVSYIKVNFGHLMSLRISVPSSSVFYDTLKGMGFRESGKMYYFGSKILKKNLAVTNEWYYTACDCI